MKIKILGSGCKNCQKLHQNTVEAVSSLNLDVDVDKITDMREIARYKVMRMPALVIDELVVISGRVPDTWELEKIIESSLGEKKQRL